MPLEALRVTIERATPLACFIDGRNVFEVRGNLQRGVLDLCPELAADLLTAR